GRVRQRLLELRDRLVEERRLPLQVPRIVRNVLHFGHRAQCRRGQDALAATSLAATTQGSDGTLMRSKHTLAAAAAVFAAAAWAHARIVPTTPTDGSVLASAPARVVIRFDDTVRVLGGTTVVTNVGRRPVTAGKPKGSGRVVTVPLRKLRDGDYTVRWRVLSPDR